jgi:hypothetical protein
MSLFGFGPDDPLKKLKPLNVSVQKRENIIPSDNTSIYNPKQVYKTKRTSMVHDPITMKSYPADHFGNLPKDVYIDKYEHEEIVANNNITNKKQALDDLIRSTINYEEFYKQNETNHKSNYINSLINLGDKEEIRKDYLVNENGDLIPDNEKIKIHSGQLLPNQYAYLTNTNVTKPLLEDISNAVKKFPVDPNLVLSSMLLENTTLDDSYFNTHDVQNMIYDKHKFNNIYRMPGDDMPKTINPNERLLSKFGIKSLDEAIENKDRIIDTMNVINKEINEIKNPADAASYMLYRRRNNLDMMNSNMKPGNYYWVYPKNKEPERREYKYTYSQKVLPGAEYIKQLNLFNQ